MNGTCCVGCEIEKEDFCAKYIVDGKCSHYREECRPEKNAKIVSAGEGSWYCGIIGESVTLVGEPCMYYGGMGYHVKGYIGRGVLISDMEFDA